MAGLPNTGGGKFLEKFLKDDDLDRRRPAGFAKGVDPQGRPSSRRSRFVKSCRVLSSNVKPCQGFSWANRLLSMAYDASRAIIAARQGFASPRLVVARPLAAAPRGRPLHDPPPPHEPIPRRAAGLKGKRGGGVSHGRGSPGRGGGARDRWKQNTNNSMNSAFQKAVVAGRRNPGPDRRRRPDSEHGRAGHAMEMRGKP
jgi:hypothetical protein